MKFLLLMIFFEFFFHPFVDLDVDYNVFMVFEGFVLQDLKK